MRRKGMERTGHDFCKKRGGQEHLLDLQIKKGLALLKILLKALPADPEVQNAVCPFPDDID